jgi:hypothetical protein
LKILVSGYLIRKPVAGLAWHYGQYLVGLQRLGHDVLYVEDSEDLAGNVDANLGYAQDVFRYLGLRDNWIFYDFHAGAWKGPAAGTAWQALTDADVLINVSGSLAMMEWFQKVPVRIFVDTDPVFTQAKTINYPAWSERCFGHTCLASFGENINRCHCGIPRDGYYWQATRQPIVLDLWATRQSPGPVFTTIMSWKSYAAVQADGTRFGLKADTFGPFKSLPNRTSAGLEIALDAESEVQTDLEAHGWGIASAQSISATADRYKAYIQASFGEFTVAKQAYVESRSGWFSERSACYLASGRPVITQDTGFSTWLDTDRGVLRFRSQEDALAALESVIGAYEVHAEAARELACYFDSAAVLQQLLDNAQSNSRQGLAPESPAALSRAMYRSVVRQIETSVPEDASLVLIDDRRFGLFGYLDRRRVYPFLENNGQYWGSPQNSRQAISELRRLMTLGADHLVVLEASRWWIDHYAEFWNFVTNVGVIALQTGDLTIVKLKPREQEGNTERQFQETTE